MKILMINVVCGIRSTGRICTDLAQALEGLGHEVRIAYGRETVPEAYQKYAVRIGTAWDVRLHSLRARALDGCGFGSKRATARFIEWVKRYDPDVIHLHNLHGYYLHLGLLFDYLRTCGKKIIWTLHDCWPFTGHAAFCEGAACERWKEGCRACPQLNEYPRSLTDNSRANWRRKQALFTGIPGLTLVTPSQWLSGLVQESFLREYPVRVIPNGIDTSRFYPLDNDFRSFFGVGQRTLLLTDLPRTGGDEALAWCVRLAAALGDGYCLALGVVSDAQRARLPASVLALPESRSTREREQAVNAADLVLKDAGDASASPAAVSAALPVDWRTAEPAAVAESIKQCAPARSQVRKAQPTASDAAPGFWRRKQALGLLGQKVLLGVAAVWDGRKGLPDLEALQKRTSAQIIVVGVTEAQKKKLPGGMLAYTRTDSVEELRQLYALADAFVNPTYEDNFPTTNIEALACGAPVVTYRTGGSPESATRVVEKGDIAGLDGDEAVSSAQCREKSRLYTREAMIRAYLPIY